MLLGTKLPSVELGILDQVLYAVRVDYVHVFNKDIPNPERIIPLSTTHTSTVLCTCYFISCFLSGSSCSGLVLTPVMSLARTIRHIRAGGLRNYIRQMW